MKNKYVIRHKRDGMSLYVLSTGEFVFTQSCATCFPSFASARSLIASLNLSNCYVVRL